MRVSLLYVCSFMTSAGNLNSETQQVVKNLVEKYSPRNIPIIAMQGRTKNLEKYFASTSALAKRVGFKDKDALPFSTLLEDAPVVNMDSTQKPYGVGVFHVFHGTTNSSDVNPGATAALTRLIMARHPPGCVRKVSILACAYGDSHSALQKSQLTKLAAGLEKGGGELPFLAAYTGYVGPHPSNTSKQYDGKLFLKPEGGTYVPASLEDWTDKIV